MIMLLENSDRAANVVSRADHVTEGAALVVPGVWKTGALEHVFAKRGDWAVYLKAREYAAGIPRSAMEAMRADGRVPMYGFIPVSNLKIGQQLADELNGKDVVPMRVAPDRRSSAADFARRSVRDGSEFRTGDAHRKTY